MATYAGIETISVQGFGILELGHGYFAEAEPVIDDIKEAIAERRPAAQRSIPRPQQGHFIIEV
ncbi:MAG: hypothetical protein KDH88_04950 [Chromatiales bacterium]|nr:hypothetical protein [Chromatiales bacterium]